MPNFIENVITVGVEILITVVNCARSIENAVNSAHTGSNNSFGKLQDSRI